MSGQMTQALLLMAWPYEDQVLTSFRFTSGYQLPPVYKGNATLTQISSSVNATNYEVIYRCQNCFEWDNGGSSTKVSTTEKTLVLGRAQAIKSVTNPGCPDKISFGFHDDGYGQYGANLESVVNPSYSAWAALATKTPKTTCDGSAPVESPTTSAPAETATVTEPATETGSASETAAPTGTESSSETSAPTGTESSSETSAPSETAPTSAPASSSETAAPTETASPSTSEAPSASASCTAVPTGAQAKTYDYIIVGAGAGGIPLADRLTAAGKSVLLIEKGPPSSGRWGGTMKPDWLVGTNLTRFDVPGLCNQIWHDSTGIACLDSDQMTGCVLGGGTAVNAGLWWKVRVPSMLPVQKLGKTESKD